jgi:HD-GYP domain-containing protein (c-di-GMP phosphodiesterase class II)
LQRAAAACAPLDKDEQLILLVGNGERDYRDEDSADLLAAVRLLAWSLARKRAGAQTLASLHRADVTVQGMVEVLCRVSDQHDPHTGGSSNRVAALAVAMARKMGMGGEQQHAVYLAARVHDIGNIGIPKEILGRPLLLGEHELALVRTHAEQGAKLLAGIELGGDIADIVHQHHERLNGSGYPRGLKQAAILPEARILAVADVVEAMCSPRPHRQALGLDAALAEISQGDGVLYDSQAVAACIRLFKEEGFQWPR